MSEQLAQGAWAGSIPAAGVMWVHAGGGEQPLAVRVQLLAEFQARGADLETGAGQQQLPDTGCIGTLEHRGALAGEAVMGEIDANINELHGKPPEGLRIPVPPSSRWPCRGRLCEPRAHHSPAVSARMHRLLLLACLLCLPFSGWAAAVRDLPQIRESGVRRGLVNQSRHSSAQIGKEALGVELQRLHALELFLNALPGRHIRLQLKPLPKNQLLDALRRGEGD